MSCSSHADLSELDDFFDLSYLSRGPRDTKGNGSKPAGSSRAANMHGTTARTGKDARVAGKRRLLKAERPINKSKMAAASPGLRSSSSSSSSSFSSMASSSSSPSSSSSGNDRHQSPAEEEGDDKANGILSGSKERQDRRKRGLQKLRISREKKEARSIRRSTSSSDVSSRLKGKSKQVQERARLREDDEMANLATSSSPFLPVIRTIDSTFPVMSEDDLCILPPPLAPVWKPRARPASASTRDLSVQGSKDPVPIESDKTLTGSDSLDEGTAFSSGQPYSRLDNNNITEPGFTVDSFDDHMGSPDYRLPPPLDGLYSHYNEEQDEQQLNGLSGLIDYEEFDTNAPLKRKSDYGGADTLPEPIGVATPDRADLGNSAVLGLNTFTNTVCSPQDISAMGRNKRKASDQRRTPESVKRKRRGSNPDVLECSRDATDVTQGKEGQQEEEEPDGECQVCGGIVRRKQSDCYNLPVPLITPIQTVSTVIAR